MVLRDQALAVREDFVDVLEQSSRKVRAGLIPQIHPATHRMKTQADLARGMDLSIDQLRARMNV